MKKYCIKSKIIKDSNKINSNKIKEFQDNLSKLLASSIKK